MYNYEKNREQVVNDLDRVIKLIHMKADEIPEEEKAQMVKETVEHFNSYVNISRPQRSPDHRHGEGSAEPTRATLPGTHRSPPRLPGQGHGRLHSR